MALPIDNIQQGVQPFLKFWNEPILKQYNQYFKIL